MLLSLGSRVNTLPILIIVAYENDADIQMLLNEKHRLLRIHQSDPSNERKKAAFTTMRSTVQSKLRQMQDSWYSRKADEIQAYADKHETKLF